ncbi:MAG: SRPBCC family protein [Chloroflexota bacterium]|nr:SRPBCC family protein [Chloroflexota bacterium]
MPSAQHSVTIRRPVGDVFAFVADGESAAKWRSEHLLDIKRVSGTGVGTVYRQGVKGPGGRRIGADYELTAYEPNRRLAFKTIAGPVRPNGEFRFEETSDGTKVTLSLEADLTGIKKLLLGAAVQRSMEAEVRATENLERAMETNPPVAR